MRGRFKHTYLKYLKFNSYDPSNFFQPSSHVALEFQSVGSHTIADQLYYDRIAEENLVEQEGCMYVCIEVALRGDAHGIGRSNWAKGKDPSGSWVQYPNPAVPPAPRHSRWIILTP